MKNKKIIIQLIWILIWLITMVLIVFSKLKEDTKLVINNLNMSSTIVYDVNKDEILFQNNIHQRMLPASLTKVLTALTVYKNIDINKIIPISYDMINIEGSRVYLEVGDLISVKDLLCGLILQSGNDAALALQYGYSDNPNDFIIKMNEIVEELNLRNSSFKNSTGLDSNEYNYTTTYDYAMIVKEVLKYDYLKDLLGIKKYTINLSDRKLMVTHKHKLLFNDNYIIGGKTGYTKKAGRTLLSIYENHEHTIIIVTFNNSNDWNVHKNLAQKFL